MRSNCGNGALKSAGDRAGRGSGVWGVGVGWGLQGLAIERLGRCKRGSNDLHEREKRTDGKMAVHSCTKIFLFCCLDDEIYDPCRNPNMNNKDHLTTQPPPHNVF